MDNPQWSCELNTCSVAQIWAGEDGPTGGAATLQISRRYHIHPQVNVLTKHVLMTGGNTGTCGGNSSVCTK